eukprot:2408525-Rhodomonas_salina.1
MGVSAGAAMGAGRGCEADGGGARRAPGALHPDSNTLHPLFKHKHAIFLRLQPQQNCTLLLLKHTESLRSAPTKYARPMCAISLSET